VITKDDIEVFIGKDTIEVSLRASLKKHYGIYDAHDGTSKNAAKMEIVERMVDELWRYVRYGEERIPNPISTQSR
jgi:hypothetical protein